MLVNTMFLSFSKKYFFDIDYKNEFVEEIIFED